MSQSYLAQIALLAIFFDESRNVRGDWEYDTTPNAKYKPGEGKAGLFEDIEQNGLQTPLWISKLTATRRKAIHASTGLYYDFICLRGHRRGRVLKQLALKHPGRFDTVGCQVFEGLSEADEIGLLVDQINVKGLSDWGIYLAIKRLALTGLSEDAIGTKIGRSRGYVQAKLRIARSPQCVEDAFKAKAEGKPFVNLTEANLVTLAASRKQDEDSGIFDPTGGPMFKSAWEELVKSGHAKPVSPTAKTRNDLLNMVNVLKDPILVNILRYAAGDPIDLNESINAINTLREKALAWDSSRSEPVPTAPAPSEPVPTAPAPSDPAPSDPAPSDPAPSDPHKGNPAPSEPAPSDPAPTATIPFETEPAPSDPAPSDPAPSVKGNGRKGNGKRK